MHLRVRGYEHLLEIAEQSIEGGRYELLGRNGIHEQPVTLMRALTNEFVAGKPFAMLAVVNAHAEVETGTWLSCGVGVLTSVPILLGEQLIKWIGSLREERLRRANLVLVSQFKSEEYLKRVMFLLRLSGVLEYEDAELISGVVGVDGLTVREMGRLPSFKNTKGYVRSAIDLDRIEEAMTRTDALCDIELLLHHVAGFRRFMRGVNVLKAGFLETYGQERNHQFVRALEALILPRMGRTARDFVHRGQTFALGGAMSSMVLGESFDMRGVTEHLQDGERALQSYPPSELEDVALQRTRQMERLASFAYGRILDERNLWPHFVDDSGLAAFWRLLDDQRRAIWGAQLDLSIIPLVHKYDQRNRAL